MKYPLAITLLKQQLFENTEIIEIIKGKLDQSFLSNDEIIELERDLMEFENIGKPLRDELIELEKL